MEKENDCDKVIHAQWLLYKHVWDSMKETRDVSSVFRDGFLCGMNYAMDYIDNEMKRYKEIKEMQK